MKSGVFILNHDRGFRNMKKDFVMRYGKAEADCIWKNAGKNLEDLCQQYAQLPEKIKAHTDGNMFRNAAVYMALKEAHPDEALDIMDQGVRKEGARVAGMLSAVLHLPGMKRLMLSVFAWMLNNFFGEDAGFKSTKHCISKDEVRFDITQCPYCKYLTEIGCSEIIRFSCDVDEYIYGNLPGLQFTRTGTLGTGASCCDFSLKIKE